MSWPRVTTDFTLLPDQSLFAIREVCDVTGKEVLATDYYHRQAVMRGKPKIKHASPSVMRSLGGLDAVSVVVHYATLHEMKLSTVAPDAHCMFVYCSCNGCKVMDYFSRKFK